MHLDQLQSSDTNPPMQGHLGPDSTGASGTPICSMPNRYARFFTTGDHSARLHASTGPKTLGAPFYSPWPLYQTLTGRASRYAAQSAYQWFELGPAPQQNSTSNRQLRNLATAQPCGFASGGGDDQAMPKKCRGPGLYDPMVQGAGASQYLGFLLALIPQPKEANLLHSWSLGLYAPWW
jgi:hypothetical protein